jgi:TRAP-type C4-dicarboxylate transport system permease small subunit
VNRLYYAWRTFQERFVQYIAAALLLVLTLLAGLEVIRRYVFGVSFEWQQDAVTFGILAGVYLFFAVTQSRGAHLRVTIVLILLREKAGRWGRVLAGVFEIFGAAVGLAFCAWLVWWGLEVADLMILQERKTESLAFLLWHFFAVFLLGMAFLAVSYAFQLYHHICTMMGGAGLEERYQSHTDEGSLL